MKGGALLGAALLPGCGFEPREVYEESPVGGAAGRGGAGGAAGGAGQAGSGATINIAGSPPLGNAGSTSAAAGSAGNTGLGGSGATPVNSGFAELPMGMIPTGDDCGSSAPAIFCDALVWNQAPAQRTLYSWTTSEQLAELRADPTLLTRTEREGMGRGYAFTSIDALAARGNAPANELLTLLSSVLFTKVRYAWPHPFATRMGWPDEDYGEHLIEIKLRPEAWTVVVRDDLGMSVIDADNRIVPVATALGELRRIGAVYFVRTLITGSGSFFDCSGGYREFILGNEEMVEEWSLETEAIRTRIEADATRVDRLIEALRGETQLSDPATFSAEVACHWDNAASGELTTYERALALASPLYLPRPAELAAIATTLRSGLFEPNPLIVKPGG